MILVVGLGNPGQKFENTWHNLGFLAVDGFKENNNFPDFKFSKKNDALISVDLIGNEKVILAKPQTFMNNSGRAVKSLLSSTAARNVLVVIHDDIDLPLGSIKVSKSRGAAGHKGVESIINNLKTKDFVRIRIGILPEKKPENVENFVLKKFKKEKQKIVKEKMKNVSDIIETIIKEGEGKAMTKCN